MHTSSPHLVIDEELAEETHVLAVELLSATH